MKNNHESNFIKKIINNPEMLQDVELHSNLTREEIIEVLNGSRESGSVRLTGTREERKKQLRELRKKDLKK